MIFTVYKIKNKMTGMTYIGVTRKDPKERLKQHLLSGPMSEEAGYFGKEIFGISTIAEFDLESDALAFEGEAIDENGYHPKTYNRQGGARRWRSWNDAHRFERVLNLEAKNAVGIGWPT